MSASSREGHSLQKRFGPPPAAPDFVADDLAVRNREPVCVVSPVTYARLVPLQLIGDDFTVVDREPLDVDERGRLREPLGVLGLDGGLADGTEAPAGHCGVELCVGRVAVAAVDIRGGDGFEESRDGVVVHDHSSPGTRGAEWMESWNTSLRA